MGKVQHAMRAAKLPKPKPQASSPSTQPPANRPPANPTSEPRKPTPQVPRDLSPAPVVEAPSRRPIGPMAAAGMKLEAPAYATFVRGLRRSGSVADAYEVFDYAIETKSFTEVTAYTELDNSLKWLRRMKS